MRQVFRKSLSANDVGRTGGHQGGVLIPKSPPELRQFLPPLDRQTKNPSVWIICRDSEFGEFRFRYVYYNNKLHDEGGTRNEYRITFMTKYFKRVGAHVGDAFELSGDPSDGFYAIRVIKPAEPEEVVGRIKLTGWRRLH